EYSCNQDSECPEDRFCLGDVCVDPCPILNPCQGALRGGICVSRVHRPVCQCPDGTIPNSAGDVCVPENATEQGCQHEGRLYAVNETRYLEKCQEQCVCGSDGAFSCGPVTCPPGLFLAGQHSKEELCIELRNRPETDECCVVVACANSLTHPSLLSSPAELPTPIMGKDAFRSLDDIDALLPIADIGNQQSLGPERPKPITEEEYQRRLKDLEDELNKGKKKVTGTKVSSIQREIKTESTDQKTVVEENVALSPKNNDTVTDVPTMKKTLHQDEDLIDVTKPPMPEKLQNDSMAEEDMVENTKMTVNKTTAETNRTVDGLTAEGNVTTGANRTVDGIIIAAVNETAGDEDITNDEQKAVVVEYDDQGEEIHRITVAEQVEVVTLPGQEVVEMTTMPETDGESTEQPLIEESESGTGQSLMEINDAVTKQPSESGTEQPLMETNEAVTEQPSEFGTEQPVPLEVELDTDTVTEEGREPSSARETKALPGKNYRPTNHGPTDILEIFTGKKLATMALYDIQWCNFA
ncbi:hypothetical protein SK128_017676, partial [Halocaridina rubra]